MNDTDLDRPAWSRRTFRFGHPEWMLADFAERLRGTPDRLAALFEALPPGRLHEQPAGTWSIAQNAGHLADVEELWEQRLEDLRLGRATYTPARPDHFTELAKRHQTRKAAEIVAELRRRRGAFVAALENAGPELQTRSAYHERLACPMRLVDCAQFVAEHDDHHLLRIRAIAWPPRSPSQA